MDHIRAIYNDSTDACEDCGELDEAGHSTFNCLTHKELRIQLHEIATDVRRTPWNLATLIRNPATFAVLKQVAYTWSLRKTKCLINQ